MIRLNGLKEAMDEPSKRVTSTYGRLHPEQVAKWHVCQRVGQAIEVRGDLFMNIFQGVIIAGIYYCGITRSYPEYLLGAGTVILISGIIAGRITRHN